jgi:hypothetical protein
MPEGWPAASYENWRDTCDTLHAHSQVLGKAAGSRGLIRNCRMRRCG